MEPVGGGAQSAEVGRWGRPLKSMSALASAFALLSWSIMACTVAVTHSAMPSKYSESQPRLAFPLRRGLSGVLVTALEKVTYRGISNRRTCLSLWRLSFWSLIKERSDRVNASQCTLEAANALQALREPR